VQDHSGAREGGAGVTTCEHLHVEPARSDALAHYSTRDRHYARAAGVHELDQSWRDGEESFVEAGDVHNEVGSVEGAFEQRHRWWDHDDLASLQGEFALDFMTGGPTRRYEDRASCDGATQLVDALVLA
jgi:hypothetical protein